MQLMLLVLAILVPATAMVAWLLAVELQNTRETARLTVRLLADNTAADVARYLRRNEAILARLAERPATRALDPNFCGQTLAEYLNLHPEFVTLGLRDRQARLVCTSLANPPSTSQVAGSAWFTDGLRREEFSAADALLGPTTGRWVSIQTFPVRDTTGAIAGLLALPVDLLKMGAELLGEVPRSAIVTVLDRTGAVLLRSADPGAFIGKRGPTSAEAATRGMREGFLSTTGMDGVTRLWAYVTIPGVEWRVVAGLPEAEVFAPYEARLRRSLGIGGGILLLALLLAWRIGAAIARPVAGLAAAAAGVAAGDSAARSRADGPAEISAVAQQFNRMLDARDRNEAALRLSDVALKAISQGVVITDVGRTVLSANAAFTTITGHAQADIVGRNCSFLQGPLTDPATVDTMRAACQQGEEFAGQILNYRKDGSSFWNELAISPVRDTQGQLTHFIGVMRDISERITTELERRRNENRLMMAEEMAAIGGWDWHLGYRDSVWSDQLYRIYGRNKSDGVPAFDAWQETIHPDDRERLARCIEKSSAGESSYAIEFRIHAKDSGELRYIDSRGASAVDRHGKVVRVWGVDQDITRRRLEEQSLRESEENLSITLRAIGDAVIATDATGRVTRMNPTAERLCGWPLAEALGRPLADVFRIIHAETGLPAVNPAEQVMRHGEVVGLADHTALIARDGSQFQISDSVAPIHDAAGRIVGVVLVFSDVSGQYQVAQALQLSEERFRSSFTASGVGMAITALDGRWVQVNQALCDIVGYTEAELLQLTFQVMTHPDDLAQDLEHMEALLAGTTRSFQMEKRYIHHDGHPVWISLSVALVRDTGGAPRFTVAHMQDISRRKALEQELRASEQRYRRIVQTAEEGIWTIDAQARTTYVNPKMAAMLGYTTAEMLGRELTDFMDNEGREITQKNLERRRQGISEQHDFKFQRKNGSALWTLMSTNPILDADAAYAGALAMVTDITARRQAEDALRSSLREKEALLREVHHRVKNNLQVVHSLLRLESGRNLEPTARTVLRDMQGRIQSMALLHESLYRSRSFAAVDLGAYLRQVSTQAMRANAAKPGAVRLELDLASVQIGLDQAAPCGLVVNELLSNCLKHAFPDEHSGTVRVELQAVDGSPQLRLRVSDDGVGLPVDFEARRASALGLQLVADLTTQLHGTLSSGSAPGAWVELRFTPQVVEPVAPRPDPL